MARDDAVKLGERLDLVNDHAPHLGRALSGLLRQFENVLAQLCARCFDLTAHLGPHFLQLLAEVPGSLQKHRTRLFRNLFVDIRRGLGLTFLMRAGAHFVPIACESDDTRNRTNTNESSDLASAIAQKCSSSSWCHFLQEAGEVLRSHSLVCDFFE